MCTSPDHSISLKICQNRSKSSKYHKNHKIAKMAIFEFRAQNVKLTRRFILRSPVTFQKSRTWSKYHFHTLQNRPERVTSPSLRQGNLTTRQTSSKSDCLIQNRTFLKSATLENFKNLCKSVDNSPNPKPPSGANLRGPIFVIFDRFDPPNTHAKSCTNPEIAKFRKFLNHVFKTSKKTQSYSRTYCNIYKTENIGK